MSDHNPILATAQIALAAGMTPIRAKRDGSKAPLGQWKRWQSVRPDELTVAEWFHDWPNVGLVTGTISDRLVCIEFEGRFMRRLGDVRAALQAADLWGWFDGWVSGYSELTPSGGLHILIHVSGDGPLDGNRKVAVDADGETTIETRGEGGFVIIAPSNGDTHPSGGAWSLHQGDLQNIAWVTPEELDAVLTVLASFDERPQAVLPDAPVRLTGLLSNDRPSWIDAATSSYPAMATVLEAHGWTYHHADFEHSYWTRPGKDRRRGWSATVNQRDRLCVFSQSAHPLIAAAPRTYDVIDVIGAYDLGHLPTTDERVGVIRRFGGPSLDTRPAAAPPGLEVATDELSLPDEFWESREELSIIRAAARSRLVSPDAVLVAVMARVAACTSHLVHLPPLIGGSVPLSFLTLLVGPPEAGKSGAFAVAKALIQAPGGVVDDVPIGTGEGLIDILFEMVSEADPANPGKQRKVKRQTRFAANVFVDEGTALTAIGGRSGATLMPTLRTIFTGGALGQTNADIEKRRNIPPGQAVYGVVVAVQPEMAGALLAHHEQLAGTPQRFVFANALDPGAPRVVPDWPGPLAWRPPSATDMEPYLAAPQGGGYRRAYVGLPDSVASELVAYRQDTQQGVARELLDAHRNLLTEKAAALLALLGGRLAVSEADWLAATTLISTSRAVRSNVVQRVQAQAALNEEVADERLVRRQVRIERGVENGQLARTVDAVERLVRKGGEARRTEINRALSGVQRPHLDLAIDALLASGKITAHEIEGQGQSGVVYRPVDK